VWGCRHQIGGPQCFQASHLAQDQLEHCHFVAPSLSPARTHAESARPQPAKGRRLRLQAPQVRFRVLAPTMQAQGALALQQKQP
jgi:hypothetical protein